MTAYTVHFMPADIHVPARTGDNLLQLAVEAGIHINASCGGDGACGKCRVIVKSGQVACRDCEKLSSEEYARGWRLACRTSVLGDVEVLIPQEADLDKKAVREARAHAIRHITPEMIEISLIADAAPPVSKYMLRLTAPTLADNAADLTRLLRSLRKDHGIEVEDVELGVLQALPHAGRSTDWAVTVSVAGRRIIACEQGDCRDLQYAAAFDIGTTSLWGQLVDIKSRAVLAEVSAYNPQIAHGDDVISRIVYSQKKGGRARLQKVLLDELNRLIGELVLKAGVSREAISHITAAGNTVMTHMLLGIDTKYLREAPYVPAATSIPPLRAVELGIAAGQATPIFMLPCVASYVGGDIVSGVVASGMYASEKLTLYIDIGTNGEIVLGNRDWLMTASCSAGPAFEGGGLTCGMRASPGAIEGFNVADGSHEPMIVTIGRTRPQGICGSGAINIVAEFMQTGIIARNGKFDRSLSLDRVRQGAVGIEYVLAPQELSAGQTDIVITEADIDNIMRAKAAMFAGCHALLEKAGRAFSDLEQVFIAGAFGDYIDLENAIAIGLFPDIPRERYTFIGNGSLQGARLGALSGRYLKIAEDVARKMTNIELSEDHLFMDKYIAGIFLPHTDAALFPSVTPRLVKSERAGV